MRAGIRLKLFFTLLIALCTVVLAMVMLMQWSFDRGFRRYVETMEQERIERLSAELAEAYLAAGDWDFLRHEPARWRQLLRTSSPAGESGRPRRERLERPRDAVPDLPPHVFEARVFLLSRDHTPVIGGAGERSSARLHPVTLDGATVGYLGLLPHRKLEDLRQLRFVQQQKRDFLLIGLLLACGAALLSIPLAHSLVRRIVRLAEGTHRLASGRFDSPLVDDSGDELGQLARDFNALARTLEQNEVARRQWVADISHELRTPVAILRGEIEALRDGVRPTTAEALASLHSETLRLQRLVEDLHQLALSDIGALTCRKETIDLVPLLQGMVADYRPLFARRNIELSADLPAGAALLRGDGERLRQLCGNLLENSLKYTDPGGRAELRLHPAADEVLIELADSAPDVPAADLPRLFERLFRVESSRNRASGGAGLGLTICRAIVEAHAGTITAAPSPLGGVRIVVTLPRAGGR